MNQIAKQAEDWRDIKRYLIAATVWCLILIPAAGFSARQGTVLGLLLAALTVLAISGPTTRFVPYWVRVSPNWYQILTDFKLIGSLEEWRSIRESVGTSADYRVLRDGVLFTVVQRFESFEQTLIFWNQHQLFTSEFSFSEDMTPIQFELATDPVGYHPPARFFMKPWASGVAGYSLGIEVRGSWWEKAKDLCATPLAVETNPLTGSVDLTLTALPQSEFDIYRDPADRWATRYISKTEPQIRKQRDEHRANLGWKDTRLPHEPGLGSPPQSIEHKYFRVEHKEI